MANTTAENMTEAMGKSTAETVAEAMAVTMPEAMAEAMAENMAEAMGKSMAETVHVAETVGEVRHDMVETVGAGETMTDGHRSVIKMSRNSSYTPTYISH